MVQKRDNREKVEKMGGLMFYSSTTISIGAREREINKGLWNIILENSSREERAQEYKIALTRNERTYPFPIG